MSASLNLTTSASAPTCDTEDATSASPGSSTSGLPFSPNAMMNALAARSRMQVRGPLRWLPDHGIGYHPLEGSPPDYFQHYAALDATHTARRLNYARMQMLNRHWIGPADAVVDIGIGSGAFVELAQCKGFDVQPAGIEWLQRRGRFVDPYKEGVRVACFWDSLEHIPDPAPLLSKVTQLAFVSLPVFRDLDHLLASKHFKPAEHCWYFTDAGFRLFMRSHGWEYIEKNDFESAIGRDGILSYAFELD
jgi:hypothetical protein